MQDDCLYIIQEYAQNGDLHKLIRRHKDKEKKRLKETQLWGILYEILLGMKHLHDNGVIHRDLKPLNIFMSSKQTIKIGDLGVCKTEDDSNEPDENNINNARVGTPLYLAPELVKNKSYDFKVDIWALGIIMYYLTCLIPPFSGDSLNDLATSILNTTPKELPKYYTTKFKTLIYTFLSKNPDDRPSTEEALFQIPQIIKTAYESELRFTEVKDRSGALSSRDSPSKRVTDLPLEIIPIPVSKKTVKMNTEHLNRPISAYKNNFNAKSQHIRPNTGIKSRRINLKFAMNLDNFRHKSNFSENLRPNAADKEYFKPKKGQIQIGNHPKLELRVLKR